LRGSKVVRHCRFLRLKVSGQTLQATSYNVSRYSISTIDSYEVQNIVRAFSARKPLPDTHYTPPFRGIKRERIYGISEGLRSQAARLKHQLGGYLLYVYLALIKNVKFQIQWY
jgi:hypothetical protein